MTAATPRLTPIARGARGLLVVLAGPSGVGKSSVREGLMTDPLYLFSVSATTRAPRAGERDGVHYHFLGAEDFAARRAAGAFLESVEVYPGTWYGTLRAPAEQALARGRIMLLDIDVDGARRLAAAGLPVKRLFVAPPDVAALARRLAGRGTETAAQIAVRRARWERELAAQAEFDATVVNDDLARCVRAAHAWAAAWYERVNTEVSAGA